MISRTQIRPPLFESKSVLNVKGYDERHHLSSSHLRLDANVSRYYSANEGGSAIWKAYSRAGSTHRRSYSDELGALNEAYSASATSSQTSRSISTRGPSTSTMDVKPRSVSADHTVATWAPGYDKLDSTSMTKQQTQLYAKSLEEEKARKRAKKRKITMDPRGDEQAHCKRCGTSINSRTELEKHSCQVTIVRCPYFPQCMFHTIDRFDLRDHVFSLHLNSPFFRCEKCDKRFEVAKGIYNHIVMSDKEHPDFEKEWQGWMDAHPQYDYRGLGIMLTT